ncbi:pirin family protein, partial [Paracoccus sp. (in: a-proteobacteria)]|uniref:pirin family protein n=1 Tax=Paracoccus sp. TaxID=267 RepID=UPI003A83ACD3
SHEDIDPIFEHHGQQALPLIEAEGAQARLILGRAYGEVAPATLYSDTFYLDVTLTPGARFPLPDDHEDRGLYITEGSVRIAGQEFQSGQMMVFRPGDAISAQAGEQGARLMALGGETLNGPRFIWWNFVASSRERIETAKREWRDARWGQGLFDLPPGDRDEFIPLP